MAQMSPREKRATRMPLLEHRLLSIALAAQRRVRGVLRLALGILVVAAIAGALRPYDFQIVLAKWNLYFFGTLATVFYLIVLGLRIFRTLRKPERPWYSARTLKEELKSLAWQYAVGGSRFSLLVLTPQEAYDAYWVELRQIVTRVSDEHLGVTNLPSNEDGRGITDWMQTTRLLNLTERVKTYRDGRIQDQINYYNERAAEFQTKTYFWNRAMFVIEAGGILAGILVALGVFKLDLFGVIGTLVAAFTSWIQFNQYEGLAEKYNATSLLLQTYIEASDHRAESWNENSWGTFVTQVETTLEVEHVSWVGLMRPQGASIGVGGI